MKKYLIDEIYNLKTAKEKKEEQLEKLKNEISEISTEIDTKSTELLEDLKTESINDVESNNLIATRYSRNNVGYKDEKLVIQLLKEKYNGSYIKVTTKETVDKIALKKGLNVNENLASELAPLLNPTTTEYVVVTTKENHEKMLNHINS